MNWLAHIFLSEYNIEFQIANYLADPLKGKVWDNASIHIQNGMKIHKLIDSYTDSHKLFKISKNRLGNKGLLKAVVIDLSYDYLLTKNWDKFSKIPLDEFLNEFYENSYQILPTLPACAAIPLKRMIDFDLLNKYQSLEQLNEGFLRVDKRLSDRLASRDKASNYYERVCSNIDKIEEDFLEFFPQLCKEVERNTNKEFLTHWK
ncbi:hypothetical protein CRV01_06025 [Arcobacter sp. CECT 8983]|uniref:acyl carrier protein phosphodiesterase n=1 Tax=Arcobacter sp. CECT 8983 TaxID=2044508 RepID=UPI00100B9419|nr:acyl carrier protein phosphodiesterase [Arcobacter sp. CECT 8983]RXJ90706.1 hypothetical protein CRV01_06025 [Arcobacter sp. CECT 8983]